MTTEEILKEQYQNLPQAIKDFIKSSNFDVKMQTITNRLNLNLDEAAVLENEIIMVLIGLSHPKDFVENLCREMAIPNEKGREIAKEVNNEIFLAIREMLKKIYDESGSGESVNNVSDVQPTTKETTNEPAHKTILVTTAEQLRNRLEAPHYPEVKPLGNVPTEEKVPENILNALKNIPPTKDTLTPAKKSPAPDEITKKYTTDPYREPTE